ncbi:MAG TPA: hypothetical protein IGS37_18275 [Synechococcales cyanobacterium M55_K2018_004]|nr:hypothetical protein [Synechococcales cyanobacterium M55_K2018_004]
MHPCSNLSYAIQTLPEGATDVFCVTLNPFSELNLEDSSEERLELRFVSVGRVLTE